MHYEDGDSLYHPLWAAFWLFRNLRVTSQWLCPLLIHSKNQTQPGRVFKAKIYHCIWVCASLMTWFKQNFVVPLSYDKPYVVYISSLVPETKGSLVILRSNSCLPSASKHPWYSAQWRWQCWWIGWASLASTASSLVPRDRNFVFLMLHGAGCWVVGLLACSPT